MAYRAGMRGWLCGLFLAMVALSSVQAARELGGLELDPESGISMRLTNAYEDLPPCGFLPLRVEIKNHSSQTREWEFRGNLSRGPFFSSSYSTRMSVAANTEQSFDILIPLVSPANNSVFNGSLTIIVSGYGVVRGIASEYSSFSGRTPLPYLGMGEALAAKNWGVLKKEIETDRTYDLDGTSLSIPLLPDDWKGLVCFSALILADSEWRTLNPSQREAVMSWVTQGGQLVLVHEQPDPLGLPAQGVLGAGRVEYWPLDLEFVARSKKLLFGLKDFALPQVLSMYSPSWPIAKNLGIPELPRVAIILFVIVFALVVGPVNLLLLAPSGNRHRLFWTTPLISLSATVLLVIFILLSEGVGGKGARRTLEFFDVATNRKVIWQDQASRTGVLMGSSFTLSPAVAPFYLSFQKSTSGSRNSLRSGSFFTENGEWGGAWFRSRSLQGQAFIAVEPTRERLDVSWLPSGAPMVRSNFSDELQDVWLFGPNDTVWHAATLAPGVETTFQSGSMERFKSWFEAARKNAGPLLRSRSGTLADEPGAGKFFASRKPSPAIPTLNAIRWETDSGMVVGQINP